MTTPNPYSPPSGASQEPPIDAELAEKTPLWVMFACWAVTCVVYFSLFAIIEYLIRIDVLPSNDEVIVWLRRVLLKR